MKFGNTISINDLQENKDNIEYISNHFISLEKYFRKYDEIILDEKKLEMFLNGVKLNTNLKNGVYRICCKNKLVGIGIVENNRLKRDIIL